MTVRLPADEGRPTAADELVAVLDDVWRRHRADLLTRVEHLLLLLAAADRGDRAAGELRR